MSTWKTMLWAALVNVWAANFAGLFIPAGEYKNIFLGLAMILTLAMLAAALLLGACQPGGMR
jgi:uncharacterized protein YhhL (DUF1145 family)